MVPTCKDVAPYIPISLNVGTIVFIFFFIMGSVCVKTAKRGDDF